MSADQLEAFRRLRSIRAQGRVRRSTLVVGSGILAVAIAVLALKDKAIEQWLVWKLESETGEQKASVAWEMRHTESAVPALIAALHDDNAQVRHMSAAALGRIGAESAVPHLIGALSDEDRTVQIYAIGALRRIDKRLDLVIPAFKAAFSDAHSEVRGRAARALGRFGARASETVPSLIKLLLTDNDGTVRKRAATALGNIGPAAESAIPALTKAAKIDDRFLGEAASASLKKLGK